MLFFLPRVTNSFQLNAHITRIVFSVQLKRWKIRCAKFMFIFHTGDGMAETLENKISDQLITYFECKRSFMGRNDLMRDNKMGQNSFKIRCTRTKQISGCDGVSWFWIITPSIEITLLISLQRIQYVSHGEHICAEELKTNFSCDMEKVRTNIYDKLIACIIRIPNEHGIDVRCNNRCNEKSRENPFLPGLCANLLLSFTSSKLRCVTRKKNW